MILWRTDSLNSEFSKSLASRFLLGGAVLIGLGMLILAVPQLVVIPLAILFFLIGGFSLMTAWRIFWSSRERRGPEETEYEDATFREIR